jgi:hypothetical protein
MSFNTVELKKSTNSTKKMMAIFRNSRTGKQKTIHFGAAGSSDFTINKDPDRKNRYLSRHRKRENWEIAHTAGSLSRWLLWSKKTIRESFADYLKLFNLKKYKKKY